MVISIYLLPFHCAYSLPPFAFYKLISLLSYLLFTDYCIYWVHRWLHLPVFYKFIHKPHHKWISRFLFIYPLYSAQQVTLLVPTPFASHAFHPLDGYMQSIPYHLFIFIFPIHRLVYLVLFVLVNMWSIFVKTLFFLYLGSYSRPYFDSPTRSMILI